MSLEIVVNNISAFKRENSMCFIENIKAIYVYKFFFGGGGKQGVVTL